MLKSDLHLHSGEDKAHNLKYSAKDLINHAAKQGFEVMSLTFHGDVFYNKEIVNYAKKKGILLISGTERMIEGKEVLIYNITKKEADKLHTFDDLRALKKKKDILIVAPHPYFLVSICLGEKLVENIDLFDGIEYSHFYTKLINLNKRAVRVAKKYNLAIIGQSDAHRLEQIGMNYSLIDSKKNIKDVFNAIRKNKVKLATKPPSLRYMISKTIDVILNRE